MQSYTPELIAELKRDLQGAKQAIVESKANGNPDAGFISPQKMKQEKLKLKLYEKKTQPSPQGVSSNIDDVNSTQLGGSVKAKSKIFESRSTEAMGNSQIEKKVIRSNSFQNKNNRPVVNESSLVTPSSSELAASNRTATSSLSQAYASIESIETKPYMESAAYNHEINKNYKRTTSTSASTSTSSPLNVSPGISSRKPVNTQANTVTNSNNKSYQHSSTIKQSGNPKLAVLDSALSGIERFNDTTLLEGFGNADEEFRLADKDGDGKISKAEWSAWIDEKSRLIRGHNNEKAALIAELQELRTALNPNTEQLLTNLRRSEALKISLEEELSKSDISYKALQCDLDKCQQHVDCLEKEKKNLEKVFSVRIKELSSKLLEYQQMKSEQRIKQLEIEKTLMEKQYNEKIQALTGQLNAIGLMAKSVDGLENFVAPVPSLGIDINADIIMDSKSESSSTVLSSAKPRISISDLSMMHDHQMIPSHNLAPVSAPTSDSAKTFSKPPPPIPTQIPATNVQPTPTPNSIIYPVGVPLFNQDSHSKPQLYSNGQTLEAGVQQQIQSQSFQPIFSANNFSDNVRPDSYLGTAENSFVNQQLASNSSAIPALARQYQDNNGLKISTPNLGPTIAVAMGNSIPQNQYSSVMESAFQQYPESFQQLNTAQYEFNSGLNPSFNNQLPLPLSLPLFQQHHQQQLYFQQQQQHQQNQLPQEGRDNSFNVNMMTPNRRLQLNSFENISYGPPLNSGQQGQSPVALSSFLKQPELFDYALPPTSTDSKLLLESGADQKKTSAWIQQYIRPYLTAEDSSGVNIIDNNVRKAVQEQEQAIMIKNSNDFNIRSAPPSIGESLIAMYGDKFAQAPVPLGRPTVLSAEQTFYRADHPLALKPHISNVPTTPLQSAFTPDRRLNQQDADPKGFGNANNNSHHNFNTNAQMNTPQQEDRNHPFRQVLRAELQHQMSNQYHSNSSARPSISPSVLMSRSRNSNPGFKVGFDLNSNGENSNGRFRAPTDSSSLKKRDSTPIAIASSRPGAIPFK